MSQDNQNTDLSFLEKKDANALTVKDIVITILRNLHWLVLCGVIGGFIGWYKGDQLDRIYESHAKIKIYETAQNSMMSQLEQMATLRNRSAAKSLNDEMIIIKSETAMAEVVQNLNLTTFYNYETKIIKRKRELYKDSPIEVSFLDMNERDRVNMSVLLQNDSLVTLKFSDGSSVDGYLRDTLSTNFGRVCIIPTWAYRDSYIDATIHVRKRNIYDVVADYRSAVWISTGRGTDGIIDMSLNDKSAERAADVLNMMITVYNQNSIKEQQRVVIETSKFINERIAQLDREMGIHESEIATFKSNNLLLNVDDYGQAYMETIKEVTEEQEQVKAEIKHAKYLQNFAENNEDNKLFPLTVNLNDDNIVQTIAEFNQIVLKLDKYNNSGYVNNPTVLGMQIELSTLKTNIEKLLDSYIEVLEQKLQSLKSTEQQARKKASDVPTGQLYLDNIARVQGIKEGLYLSLLTKREEMLMSTPSIEGKAGIIDRARVNPSPVAPQPKKTMVSGIVIGLLIPVGVFFIRRMLDTKVRYRKDVEAYIDVPVLGEVPSKSKKDDRQIVVDGSNRNAISEAFRILRSNIEYTRNTDGSATTYLFLSLVESSGKTFLTTNIAASLAMVDKRVILLDLDIRKGTLSRKFGMRKHVGFSDYLSGKVDDIEDFVKEYQADKEKYLFDEKFAISRIFN